MADIPSTPADGNVKVVVATAVADPSAPTVLELEAAVDISCYLTPDGFTYAQEQAVISDDRLCSTQTFSKPGRKSSTLTLTGIDNTNSDNETEYNEFVETLAEGAPRVVYARYGMPYESPFAAAQKVRVIPIDVGTKTELPPEANSVIRAMINTFVSGSSDLVAIAGP